MNQCHGMKRLAVGTDGGFCYTATINLHHPCLATHVALEKSYYNYGEEVGWYCVKGMSLTFSHFRYEGGRSDDHTTDSDQLINVYKDK